MKFATKRIISVSATLGATALIISGCGGGGATEAGDLPGFEIEGLDPDLIQAAAEEGEVFVRTGGHTPENLERLEDDMRELFGIEMTVAREATAEVYSAVEAERASGNVQTDVVGLADGTAFEQLAQDDALGDAEVPNRADIMSDIDSGQTDYIPYGLTAIGVMYNTANTDPSEMPDTWDEFVETDLNVLTANPSASGTALGFYSSILESHPDFIEDFGAKSPSVTDSSLSLAQMVLTGEVDLAIPAVEGEVMALAAEGEPIATKFMEGPVPTTIAYVGTLADAPNPNAAKLLVQYHLSEHFQTDMAERGRPTLEGVALGDAIENLDGRHSPVVAETINENGDAAREGFNESVA